MDMVAEYAHTYGGAPRPDQPWHEVLALVHRARRMELRDKLAIRDGTILAQPTDADHAGVAGLSSAALHDLAYPHDEEP